MGGMEAKTSAFRAGMIILWSGAIVDIPAGWQLCNGTNGTPDLRNRFLAGAGDTYAVDATGGALTHNHDFQISAHLHALDYGTEVAGGTDFSATTETAILNADTGQDGHLPPYYALCYIMKM